MTDPIDAIAAVAGAAKATDPVAAEAAKVGASLWTTVLSPPAEAIGEHLRARIELWSEDALAARVLKKAAKKINPNEHGSVPPRVAADVFDKAQWAEDEFLAEYLSGVLASSRTADGKDDSGVAWTSLVGRLSSDQLRMHYVLYCAFREKARAVDTPGSLDTWLSKELYILGDDLVRALGWCDTKPAERILNAMYGLEREKLIDALAYGGPAFWQKQWQFKKKALPGGVQFMILITGTASGVQLFLQAHGRGNRSVANIVADDIEPVPVAEGHAGLSALRGWWSDDFGDVTADGSTRVNEGASTDA